MKSNDLAKLRFDTMVSSVEALALAYSSCMMNNKCLFWIVCITAMYKAYMSIVYSIPLCFPSYFTKWKHYSKFWRHVADKINDRYKINI